jgi:cytidylate kinase
MPSLVTLSASYGSGGSLIGPAVAQRLDVPFVDRVIPLGVAERLDVPMDDAVAHDQKVGSWLERVLQSFVAVDTPAPLVAEDFSAEEFRRATEEVISRQVATGGGVILGRAGAVLLRDDPRVLRVRVDGPPERRIRQAVALGDIAPDIARQALAKADHTHAAYVRHFYNEDVSDPRLYHLVIDSTAIGIDASVETIVAAANNVATMSLSWDRAETNDRRQHLRGET